MACHDHYNENEEDEDSVVDPELPFADDYAANDSDRENGSKGINDSDFQAYHQGIN